MRVGGEQRRDPQQRIAGLGDKALEGSGLLNVHIFPSLSLSPLRRQLVRSG
jgi:hypothetical protein